MEALKRGVFFEWKLGGKIVPGKTPLTGREILVGRKNYEKKNPITTSPMFCREGKELLLWTLIKDSRDKGEEHHFHQSFGGRGIKRPTQKGKRFHPPPV